MHARFWLPILAAVGGAALMIFVLRQRSTNDALRAESRRLSALNAETEALRFERADLLRRQASPGQLAAWQESVQEAERLRSEATALRQASKPTGDTPAKVGGQSPEEPKMEFWINAGRTSPLSTVRTMVWAAQRGETDLLAGSIAFDDDGRRMIDEMFARMPEETRTRSGNAEKAFATLLAVRLPDELEFDSAEATSPASPSGAEFTQGIQLVRADGETKETKFRFTRDSAGWRIVVPAKVVENYLATLSNRLAPRRSASSITASPLKVE
jgi:hypothetical protein